MKKSILALTLLAVSSSAFAGKFSTPEFDFDKRVNMERYQIERGIGYADWIRTEHTIDLGKFASCKNDSFFATKMNLDGVMVKLNWTGQTWWQIDMSDASDLPFGECQFDYSKLRDEMQVKFNAYNVVAMKQEAYAQKLEKMADINGRW